jgi:hypothetical protein
VEGKTCANIILSQKKDIIRKILKNKKNKKDKKDIK